ncbi:hypothetical protein BJ684DRAFT_16655, partial [Piptocephalis cylindrospora]
MSLTDLPSDILFNILKRLDAKGLCACAGTCQILRRYLQQINVWKLLLLFRFGPDVEVEEEEGLVDIRRRYLRLGRSRVGARGLGIIHGPDSESYYWVWKQDNEGSNGEVAYVNDVIRPSQS